MSNLKAYAADHIKQLDGPNRENAYHSLVEADKTIIPLLIEAFQAEHNPIIQATLVEIIWQHRVPATIDFLSEALNSSVPEVWKAALDGLVTLGGAATVYTLETIRNKMLSSHQSASIQVEWIDEALQQIKEKGV